MISIIRQTVEQLARDKRMRRHLPSGFGRRPIWVSPDARLRFLKPGDSAFDLELLAIARRLVRSGDNVLDVGANVGEFALAAAHMCGRAGHVLAVEADPFLASLIQRTSQEPANSEVRLEVICAAATNVTGIARFHIAGRGRAANALEQTGSTQMGGVRRSFWAPTLTVDALVESWEALRLIKIDVEGAELQVLEGAKRTLKSQRPLLLFEASLHIPRIERLLKDLGYQLFDPAAATFDQPLATCIFNTLAIPVERLPELG
jgi:FkbM family methyltransferase